MAYMDAAKNRMLDALAGDVGNASLHTADPGTTGANEVSGGTYARQAVSFDAASAGEMFLSASVTFDVPGGVTVAWVGFWSNDATPVFLASDDVTDEAFADNGEYTLTTQTRFDLNAGD